MGDFQFLKVPNASQRLLEILRHQQDHLTEGEKEAMNAPLTLTELGEATRELANEKCPGPDGTPAEFYKAHWNTVGPLVLESITSGIVAKHLLEYITKGAIILLPKKSDQRELVNKRLITLLNTCYKIAAKALQRRLTPILQRIIYLVSAISSLTRKKHTSCVAAPQ